MKKILPFLLVFAIIVTGCGEKSETKKIDFESVEEKLAGLAYTVNDDSKTIDLIFKENITVTDEYIENLYGVNTDNIESFLISMPSSKETAEMYAIILPKDGKANAVKKDMDKFIEQYQDEYKNTNYSEMTNNVFKQKYGNYLIYIISNKSETVYNTITGN